MLKGQGKKDYQREYQRKHQKAYRLKRSNQQSTGLITKKGNGSNQDVKTSIPGLVMQGNKIVGATKAKPGIDMRTPLYNATIHRAGDRVLMQVGTRLIETIVPELDVEGNIIP